MNGLVHGFMEALVQLAVDLPRRIGRALPGWLAKNTKAYLKWLWRLDLTTRILMVVLTIVVIYLGLSALPGPHSLFESVAGLIALALMFFLIASALFGGPRR